MPRNRTRVIMSRPGHRCTRASNVSPSMVRSTSTGCRTLGLPARRQTASLSLPADREDGCDASVNEPGQCGQCRAGSMVPAAIPRTNTQGSAADNLPRHG